MNTDHQEPKSPEDEDLKTFDMYHFFSRKDVIAMIVFIVVLLAYIVFKLLFSPGII